MKKDRRIERNVQWLKENKKITWKKKIYKVDKKERR
jgi:hypothetical protein